MATLHAALRTYVLSGARGGVGLHLGGLIQRPASGRIPQGQWGAAMQRLAIVAFAVFAACCAAHAQVDGLTDFISVEEAPDGTPFATGLLPVDRKQYEELPATPLHRDFLPVSVDLSTRFPRPGDQGRMGSCVAWAVGYAARSYYAHSHELRARNSAQDIASPAYIYHSIRPGGCDEGSYVQSALALLKSGSVSLAAMP